MLFGNPQAHGCVPRQVLADLYSLSTKVCSHRPALSARQIWTVLQHCGPDHLGLRLIRSASTIRQSDLGPTRRRPTGQPRSRCGAAAHPVAIVAKSTAFPRPSWRRHRHCLVFPRPLVAKSTALCQPSTHRGTQTTASAAASGMDPLDSCDSALFSMMLS